MHNPSELDPHNIPGHVAIIMDGNGRWATSRKLPRIVGHKVGAESVKKVVAAARQAGIKVLTLYAFSTENWKRPELEVRALMALLKNYLKSEESEMLANGIRLRTIGRTDKLPAEVRSQLRVTMENTGRAAEGREDAFTLNLALNYGGRDELLRACRQLARGCADGALQADDLSEKDLANCLDTAGLADPDLLIRTGGERRLSNFLLWQASYAELYFTDAMWPDFREAHLFEALQSFQQRQRRFGRTGEQVESRGPRSR